METPPIPDLEQVKTILGDRVTKWTEDQIVAALAYVDTLAARVPPLGLPPENHNAKCAWKTASVKKGVLCTCDPERPR